MSAAVQDGNVQHKDSVHDQSFRRNPTALSRPKVCERATDHLNSEIFPNGSN